MSGLAAFVAGGLLLIGPQAPARPVPVALPDSCPRVVLTWMPGMPMPGMPDAARGGVVAAVWDSGLVLRASSFEQPGGAHVAGRVASSELASLLEAVKDSPLWKGDGFAIPDAAAYGLFYVRADGSRIGMAEASSGDPSPALDELRRRLFGLELQATHRVDGAIDQNRWRCAATTWVP